MRGSALSRSPGARFKLNTRTENGKEHGYSSSQAQDAYGSDSDQSSSKSSSGSDSEEDLGARPGASKRKKSESTKAPPPKAPRVLTFSPEEIVHPRSSSWVPPPEVAEYLQNHIRAGFDKDVRARLHAECPRPDLEGKVTDTPDVDPTMVTFLKKLAKDPKKGLDRAWRSCQDKLLDLSGPLAKILEMAYVAKESQSPIDPDILVLIRVEALHSRDLSVWMIASSLVRSACSHGSLDRVFVRFNVVTIIDSY
ncbi:hypothetical protein NDU88_008575 [Pleurodeles waltl]|uniref:Uncharacterized protein n=1 Tax=Pleurodeles waltl TaxID=8319 RepID=A0AAV7PTH8_PLEWA|nr:hypothetical protein NDU88_008575 [Pleurodeles waltl]